MCNQVGPTSSSLLIHFVLANSARTISDLPWRGLRNSCDMLLMKSDFILFEMMASSRLISTITELPKVERYMSSVSVENTGTAEWVQTKHPEYQRSPAASQSGMNIICRALVKILNKIAASTLCFAVSLSGVDRLLLEGPSNKAVSFSIKIRGYEDLEWQKSRRTHAHLFLEMGITASGELQWRILVIWSTPLPRIDLLRMVACSSSLIWSRDGKHPLSSKYQILPFLNLGVSSIANR